MSEVDFDDAQAPAEVENEKSEKSGRGRPRPGHTIDRDTRVHEHIKANGPKSKKNLVEELDIPANEAYLSLYRLSRANKIVRSGTAWAHAEESAE